MQEILNYVPVIFQVVLIPLLGNLTKYLVALISQKIKEMTDAKDDATYTKYMNMLRDTITDCVIATNQTYVDSLKKEGKFDAEAQKNAYEKTYAAVMAILNDDANNYLTEIVGDLDGYVSNLIESNVKTSKEFSSGVVSAA